MEGKRVYHRRTVVENLLLGGQARLRNRRTCAAGRVGMYERFPVLGIVD
jgi:branched-chain amino acid transport system ATP-binding protein